MSYCCLQYRRQTLITVFALSLLTLLLFYESKRPCFQWVCRLVTQPFPRGWLLLFYESKGPYFQWVCLPVKQAFPRVHRTANQRDSIISNTKQRKFKRPLHKEIASTKMTRCFPAFLSTITSMDYISINYKNMP